VGAPLYKKESGNSARACGKEMSKRGNCCLRESDKRDSHLELEVKEIKGTTGVLS